VTPSSSKEVVEAFIGNSTMFQTQIVNNQPWKVPSNTVFGSVKYGIHPIYFQKTTERNYLIEGNIFSIQIRIQEQ
jgi:hypothetical protein